MRVARRGSRTAAAAALRRGRSWGRHSRRCRAPISRRPGPDPSALPTFVRR